MERYKQFLVVFNCLFCTPAMVTLEVKNPLTLEESRALNSKCHLE